MEQGLNSYLKERFNLKDNDIRTYSPLTLAYIGDAIFDVVIRTIIVDKGNTSVNNLHRKAAALVRATTQAQMVSALMDELTEEEKEFYRRGRNSKPHTKAKNASTREYLEATGFEAIIGFLYLQDDWDRITHIVKCGLEKIEEKA